MRRFENWGDELRYRVERIGNDGQGEDEKNAGGVYDIARDIAVNIEWKVGQEFDDIDSVVDIIYDAIKYGKGVN